MPKQYDPPGLRHYVDAEADAMELEDGPDNHHPVARAAELEPIQHIANSVTIASNNRADSEIVTEAISHAEDQLDALLLGYRSAVVMLVEACDGLGVAIPRWLKRHAATAEPESTMTAIRKVSEPKRASDFEREILAAGLAPETTQDWHFLQDENPHPQQDPSPTQLLDPNRDARTFPRPPGQEVPADPDRKTPDFEVLPSPRQTADQSPTQAAEMQAGRRPQPRRSRAAAAGVGDPKAGERPAEVAPGPTDLAPDGSPPATKVETPIEPTTSPEAAANATQPDGPREEGREPRSDRPDDKPGDSGADQPSG